MAYRADLHLHSQYARGCSKSLTLDNLALWAGLKGIDLLSTGDFTHPARFKEIREVLSEPGDGLLDYGDVRFILGTEVNCNARQGGRSRRTHMLVFVPSLEVASRVSARLGGFGKLDSDGRPTLHLTPRRLLEVLLDVDERCFVIPAHAWTPWFGVFGSKSGFDSFEECFGDLAGLVFAVETGLSGDPAMHWRVPELDDVAIVSFSDAHSLPKMGRELTAFNGPMTYDGLAHSLRSGGVAYSLEFFPESGKYHHSGHRKCGLRLSPAQVREEGTLCAKCGKQVTLGVLERAEQLATRDISTSVDSAGFVTGIEGRPPYKMLVPMEQILSEALGKGVNTKAVQSVWTSLVDCFGNEMAVLLDASPGDIEQVGGERVAEGVGRVRRGELSIEPGYDGEYGVVSVWP
jgi:uncharacterized protein (TIGR00375 family)